MYNPYLNPYQNPYPSQNPYGLQAQSNVFPRQQVIQVNGKASVDTIKMESNSSLLAMDTTEPIVWLCVSDGVGNVTSTPYDISLHQDKPQIDVSVLENRIVALEETMRNMEDKLNEKSNASKPKSKSNTSD